MHGSSSQYEHRELTELHISFILSPADLGQALTLAEFYVQVYSPSCSLITAEPWPGPGRLLTQLLN